MWLRSCSLSRFSAVQKVVKHYAQLNLGLFRPYLRCFFVRQSAPGHNGSQSVAKGKWASKRAFACVYSVAWYSTLRRTATLSRCEPSETKIEKLRVLQMLADDTNVQTILHELQQCADARAN